MMCKDGKKQKNDPVRSKTSTAQRLTRCPRRRLMCKKMLCLVFWQRVSVSLCLSFSLSDPAGVCNLLYHALVLQRKESIMSASCVTRCLTLRPSSCVT